MKTKINKDLTLTAGFKLKEVKGEEEDLIIEGFANTTDKDRGGDVVLEEAWSKGGLDNYLNNPILLAFHDHSRPVGTMLEYGVNNKGLHITGKISKGAGEVYDLVKDNILKAFSVGFRVKDADYDAETDIFVIKDLELHEISVVSVPMNQNSLFSVKKSFENEEEYDEFKSSLIKVEEKKIDTTEKGDTNVPEKIKDDVITLTPEQLAEQTAAAITKAFAEADAKKEAAAAAAALALEAGKSGAELLVAEMEKRFEAKNAEMATALEGLQTDLKDKSDEIEAMTKSKMHFDTSHDRAKLTDDEIDTAVLVAKLLNKRVDETEYFTKNLKEKAGAHLASASEYEMIYSTRMYDAIQDKLIMEPLLAKNKIAMTSRSMTFPFNPQAGYANWVLDSEYNSYVNPASETVDTDNSSSTGVHRNHLITTIDLKAEKIASKEAIGYEEEEDSIIPILPIVREAIAKRMARTTDVELLRANAGAISEADILTAPAGFNGVSTMATDLSTTHTQAGAFGTTNPITVADLQATRRKMGSWGLNPNDVTYVVCESTYWDLLEDPDFRTMDLVGGQATILRGQVGAVNGSPVVVSDSFVSPAAGTVGAIAINTGNYLFGELRNLTTERDKDVLNQKNWIVTTRRFAFNEIDATATSVSALLYGS